MDDKSPKNFVRDKIVPLFPELKGKTHGTVGFIVNSYQEDKLISKAQCIDHLKAIHQAWAESPKIVNSERPCAMDEKFVKEHLLPLITKLENENE